MKQISESEMLHRAAAYCSASERCIQDVEKKIKAAGLAGEESDRIVSRLLQERFIDESRFARYFVNDKLRFNKWGRVKINYEMQRKGIPSSIRSEALEGIDVGAKNEIYKLMSKLAAEGKSIIMISSEMTEILRMSDRIIVMCEGKVTGNIDISEATQEHIMNKATRNID